MDQDRVNELALHVQKWAKNALDNPQILESIVTDESTVVAVCLAMMGAQVMPTLGFSNTMVVMFNLGQLYQKMTSDSPDKSIGDLLGNVNIPDQI